MAIEELAANYARLKGYSTEIRVPYLNKEDSKGNKKEDEQGGDIDIIGRSVSNKLIAIEIKGYGRVEDYDNWCKADSLVEIYYIVDKLTKVREIWSKGWNRLFEKRRKRFSEVWIIISGQFIVKQKIRMLKGNYDGYDFLNKCVKKVNGYYDDAEYEYDEKDYITLFEEVLTAHFKDKCGKIKIIPIHFLISQLMVMVSKDMFTRRKRYPDTALETFRWIARAIGHDCIELSKIQKKIKGVYDNNRR